MRLFNLFLRRAGVQPAPAFVRSTLSRLTIVCTQAAMAQVRKQIYLDFEAAGLKVVTLQVYRATDPTLVTACITVNCPPDMRSVLMKQARQLNALPAVRAVRWGDHRHIVLN